jgi:hypothetical protein
VTQPVDVCFRIASTWRTLQFGNVSTLTGAATGGHFSDTQVRVYESCNQSDPLDFISILLLLFVIGESFAPAR